MAQILVVLPFQFLAMLSYTKKKKPNSDSLVGWISTTDCLFLGLGVLLLLHIGQQPSDLASTQAPNEMTTLDDDQTTADLENALRSRLEAMKSKYQRSQESLKAVQTNLAENIAKAQSLEQQLIASEKGLVSLRALQQIHNELLATNVILTAKLAEAKKQALEALAQQANIRRELAGFRGKLERVAFVLDCSGSMKNQWASVAENITLWVQHLDVQECVFLFFDSDVEKYPKEEETYKVAAETKMALIDELKTLLADHQPDGGFTNTHSALLAAFSVPNVDTIILFTDGAPTTNASRFIEKEMAKVLDLCSENSHIPINVIGSGIYNDKKDLVDFLVKIAQRTNGTFLGR